VKLSVAIMVASAKQPSVTDFKNTGERHIPVQAGDDMSLANVDHMIRYAFTAPFVKDKRVLDISCGSGYGSQFIALQGARAVVGVDVDEDSIRFASTFYSHPHVKYIQSDAHSIPSLEDASFDVIVSFETIEHLQYPRQFLSELRRLLKPSGQLFISCPNDYRATPWLSPFHLHKFRFNEFRDLFLSVFGEGVLIGQHFVVASCLVKPIAPDSKTAWLQEYKQSLPHDFFNRQYLEHLSSIENGEGYLAIHGVDESLIQNQMSISQNAFQMLMRILCDTMQAASQSGHLHQQLQQTQAELAYMTQVAAQAQERVRAMESSKFWKVRRGWFQLKRTMGLPTNEPN
jgi:2-polyprenyl-3-methyl-5-hydroxy-6-metoxy-1,4-benzoquinol methylase